MKRILVYLAVTFALTWTLWGAGVQGPVVSGAPVLTQLAVGAGMFCPALGALAAKCSDPDVRLLLRPRLRGNGRWYACAWFGPAAFVGAGGLLYFLVFPGQFDPALGYLRETAGAGPDAPLGASLTLQLALAVFAGPLLNILTGAGEEIGWRGLLYPALRARLSPAATCIAGGAIWGLWHAPVTLRGHNYGLDYPGFPYLGVGAMCVFCMAAGTLLHALTGKTGSIWPAALAHGGLNALVLAPTMFLPSADTGSRLLGPSPSGLLAGLPLLAAAALWLVRQTRTRQPKSPPRWRRA